MEPETIEALVKSHDELMEVVKACFSVILPSRKASKAITELLQASSVEPGFAERAEKARHDAMRERIINLC